MICEYVWVIFVLTLHLSGEAINPYVENIKSHEDPMQRCTHFL